MSGRSERCSRKTCDHEKTTHFAERKVVVVTVPETSQARIRTGHPYREESEVRTVYGKCSAAWCDCNDYVAPPP